MSRRVLVRTFCLAVLALLAAGGWLFYREVGRTFSDDPRVWESEIEAFERADRESNPPRDAILFVGSSSIRFWDDLAADLAPLTVIQRGFGGARLADLAYFADRIIVPYAPRAIVIHAGGNELNDLPGNRRRSPNEARADFRVLVSRIRARLQEVPIYFLALRPSRLPGARDDFLRLVRAECEAQPGLDYLDAGAGLVLPDGSPDPRLIRWDRIHLNREGYAAWAPPIRERLMRDLGPDSIGAGRSQPEARRSWSSDSSSIRSPPRTPICWQTKALVGPPSSTASSSSTCATSRCCASWGSI